MWAQEIRADVREFVSVAFLVLLLTIAPHVLSARRPGPNGLPHRWVRYSPRRRCRRFAFNDVSPGLPQGYRSCRRTLQYSAVQPAATDRWPLRRPPSPGKTLCWHPWHGFLPPPPSPPSGLVPSLAQPLGMRLSTRGARPISKLRGCPARALHGARLRFSALTARQVYICSSRGRHFQWARQACHARAQGWRQSSQSESFTGAARSLGHAARQQLCRTQFSDEFTSPNEGTGPLFLLIRLLTLLLMFLLFTR